MPYADPEVRREYMREYMRGWRATRDEQYRERQRELALPRARQRHQERYADLVSEARWWLGDRCLHCGATEEDLEFDHTDPATKSFEVTSGWSRSDRKFFDELEKCQLLCGSCHKAKTAEDRAKASERKLMSA